MAQTTGAQIRTKQQSNLLSATQLEMAQITTHLLLRRRLRLGPGKQHINALAGVDRPNIDLVAGGAALVGDS